MRRLTVFSLILPFHTAWAADLETSGVISADAFSTYVTGKTITYYKEGQLFGIEQYLPENTVRWTARNGDCEYGEWFAQNEQICFLYDGKPEAQCWGFFIGDAGISALYENTLGQSYLYEKSRTSDPLYCKGPDAGV